MVILKLCVEERPAFLFVCLVFIFVNFQSFADWWFYKIKWNLENKDMQNISFHYFIVRFKSLWKFLNPYSQFLYFSHLWPITVFKSHLEEQCPPTPMRRFCMWSVLDTLHEIYWKLSASVPAEVWVNVERSVFVEEPQNEEVSFVVMLAGRFGCGHQLCCLSSFVALDVLPECDLDLKLDQCS